MKQESQDHLPQPNAPGASINSIHVPSALAEGTHTGRRYSHEDTAGNLRFDVVHPQSDNLKIQVPRADKAMLSRQIHLEANSTLEELESNAFFKRGLGSDLRIRALTESVRAAITAALTFLHRDLPRDRQLSIFVLCSLTAEVDVSVRELATGLRMDEITLAFLDRLKRDKKTGGHYIRQIVDDYLAQATAFLLGGVAEHPPRQ